MSAHGPLWRGQREEGSMLWFSAALTTDISDASNHPPSKMSAHCLLGMIPTYPLNCPVTAMSDPVISVLIYVIHSLAFSESLKSEEWLVVGPKSGILKRHLLRVMFGR